MLKYLGYCRCMMVNLPGHQVSNYYIIRKNFWQCSDFRREDSPADWNVKLKVQITPLAVLLTIHDCPINRRAG